MTMSRQHSSRHKVFRRMSCAALVFAALAVPALAEPLDLVITPREPYYILDDKGAVSGIVGKPAVSVFAIAGLDARWKVVSFKRQLQMIEDNNEPICAIGWFKNPRREAFAKFTDYIYQDRALIALARNGDPAVTSYQDLRALLGDRFLTMGIKLGFSYGAEVDDLIRSMAPATVTTDQSIAGMARMLLGYRFDYMISAPEEATHLIESLGTDGRELTVIELRDLSPRNKRYIMCSLLVGDDVIARLNTAIRRVREGG